MHINPDHFLETPQGRHLSALRNKIAWDLSFQALDLALKCGIAEKIYIMIGCQASGKSTWANKQHQLEDRIIIFDAILVKRSERAPILIKAHAFNVMTIAVSMQTSLDQCLAHNRSRPRDQRVNETALRNVFQAIEKPTYLEGFDGIIQIARYD